MHKNVSSTFRAVGLSLPNKIGMIFREHSWSYREIIAAQDNAIQQFNHADIHTHDVVAFVIKHPPTFCISMLAVGSLGALVIPINPKYPKGMIDKLLTRYRVNHVITDTEIEFKEDINTVIVKPDELFVKLDTISHYVDLPISKAEHSTPDSPYIIALPLLLSLSQESQDHPKAILYSHVYMLNRMDKTLDGYTASSRLIPPDMNFTMGFLTAIGTLCNGGTIVFNSTQNVPDFLKLANQHAVTHVFISAREIAPFVETLTERTNLVPSIEQFRILEGSPTSTLITEILQKISPNVFTSYGSAETGGLTLATPETLNAHPSSSGVTRPWVQLEIVDANNQPLPQGHTGQIRVRSAIAANAYFDDPEASSYSFKDNWFYTGDYGYLNADNLLFLVD
jgi:fatty-acyl-CoA synthase